jgi:hypothetical protein
MLGLEQHDICPQPWQPLLDEHAGRDVQLHANKHHHASEQQHWMLIVPLQITNVQCCPEEYKHCISEICDQASSLKRCQATLCSYD